MRSTQRPRSHSSLADGNHSLFATYEHAIPTISIEIKTAGEAGPRKLDETTTMVLHEIPWLSVTEFVRAKLKDWIVCVHSLTFATCPTPDLTILCRHLSSFLTPYHTTCARASGSVRWLC